jgi:hypothetical protein
MHSRDTPIFYEEDPNKIEITAIGSLGIVEQRQGGEQRCSDGVAHRLWIGGGGEASGSRGGSPELLGGG